MVITWGGSGIGLATALALAEVGRAVAIWDRDGAAARRVARRCVEEYGVRAAGLKVDVTKTATLKAAVKRSLTELGRIGGFVHSAGIGGAVPLTLIDDESWDEVLDVNLRAGATLTKELHPSLVAANPGAAIVYVSSIESAVGHAFLPAYCASKAGLVMFTRSLALDHGADGVRVNCVCPGLIDTPMADWITSRPQALEQWRQGVPAQRIGVPDDIAGVVAFLASPDADYIHGSVLLVDGGVSA